MALGYGVLKIVVLQKANGLNLTLGGIDPNNLGMYCRLTCCYMINRVS
jgi:hypothetical protein